MALPDCYAAVELKYVCLKFVAENLVAVMRLDDFEYLREHCHMLKSELLKTVAGCEDEFSGGGKSRSVWAQFSDGGDANDKTVRQQLWENKAERNQGLWVRLGGEGDVDDAVGGNSRRQEG